MRLVDSRSQKYSLLQIRLLSNLYRLLLKSQIIGQVNRIYYSSVGCRLANGWICFLKPVLSYQKETQPEITIVGDGPDREQIEKAAQATYPGVIFTGTKTGIDLDPFFQKADLFVLPGTGGLAVQQAMSFGLPVIVAAGDGTQSQLVRPENGWIVAPDNLDDLTKTLQTALSDPVGLRKKGLESYRIVRDEINIEKMVEVFISAINSVCKL